MKAWVLHQIGDFRLENVKEPNVQENEALVQVKAAGICGSDIPRIYETGAYSYPLIPGHEFAGVVAETGKNVESLWKGKRVGIFPLIPCGKCLPCQKKQFEMCRNYSYLGSRRDGGFAEYVSVPADNLIQLPDNVSFEEAAMLEPMAVVVHAMRRVVIAQADTIAVCGLGTIGLLLLMFLKEAQMSGSWKGGKILAIGNKGIQKETAIKIGLPKSCYCDSRQQNVDQWMLEHTDGFGAGVFFECVGKNETLVQAVNNTAPAGRILLIGNPYSDMKMEKGVYWKILRNQLTVTGTWNSSFMHTRQDDWHYVTERLAERKIEPCALISHRYSFEELGRGFRMMHKKAEEYVKVMGIIN